ncbi:MAG: acyltransferase [Kiritimatiellae bacterium]|nr:acyltransferase [Kiritimatiellia bacterium]
MCNRKWPKHLYALDVSRGFAALAVVLWHWQHFAYKGHALSQDFLRERQPLYDILRLFYENGSKGVQYFFLLSGFIFFWLYSASINNRKTTAWEFGVQRFSRLYPLHFITLLLVALLQLLYVARENASFVYPFNDIYHFFLNLALAPHWGFESGRSFNAPVWSVSIEILLYLVFFISVFFHKGGWLFCLSISLISLVSSHLIHNSILSGISLFFLGGAVFHLTLLISSGKYKGFRSSVHLITILSWFCVMIDCYAFNLSNSILEAGILGKVFLVGFPLYILFPFTVCSLALIEIDKGPFLKPISWIGNITYSSYLLHFPLELLFALTVSFGVLNSDFYLNPMYLAIYFIVLIPLSYITFLKFERPMQRTIRNRFLSRKEEQQPQSTEYTSFLPPT